jgi:hypothetical protein
MKSLEIKNKIKEVKKELKEVYQNQATGWKVKYAELKKVQQQLENELNELENSKEVRIWIECKLFNHLFWTGKKVVAIPDLPHKWNNPNNNSEYDWVKFEVVEKCENCAKLSDEQIIAAKKENKIHEQVSDELTYREIKNHGWAK